MFLLVWASTGILEAQPSLQITSPADGAVVSPGQTVTVTVVPSGANFQVVAVVGEEPIGLSEVLSAAPFQFSIQVPTNISPRRYTLSAIGSADPGNDLESASISVDVERSDAPAGVNVEPASLTVRVGDPGYLRVVATYADGMTPDVTQSTQVTYVSDTPAVATVTGDGRVTAVSPGSANITISYGGASSQVPVTVRQPVKVVPITATVNPSQSAQFYAQLAMPPGTDPTVTWSLHPALGSIDGTGLYTAPSSVDSRQRVVVTATSVADPTKSASADVQLLPPITVSIDPASASLTAGSMQSFGATLTNTDDQTVTWSVTPPGVGTFNTAWQAYIAPPTVTAPQTVTVTAASQADNTKTASAQITLVPSVAVSVSPAAATLYAYQTQQFAATTNFTGLVTAVSWSITPSVGTITGTGLYTAPSLIAYPQTITIMATAIAGYTATATVTLTPNVSASVPTPAGLAAATASASEIDLSWNASTGDIAGYSIYRGGTLVGTSTSTSYSDLGLVRGKSYTYTVVAYDTVGTNSAPSASVSATTRSDPPPPGLVASWNLDEGVGTVAHDSSGNGNNGAVSGATWTGTGRLTNALQFNAGSWVTVPDSTSLDLTTGMTLEAWVNPSSPIGWQAVIVKEQDRDLCYGLFGDNTWPAANMFTGSEQVVYGNQHLPWAGWAHLAVTYDGTNENLYLNGALVGSTATAGPIATSPQPLRIGGDSVWGQHFLGMIEEVRIYNRALGPAEIQTDMRAVTVTVSPASAMLHASQTQQFTAAVTNISSGTNSAVTWSVSPSLGTIDASGLYTAPAIVASAQSVTVSATSQYDQTRTGTGTIALQPQISGSVSAPQGLMATVASCSQVNLSWTAASGGVAGYYIVRDGALVGTSATTSYSDLGLVLSTPYTYTVVAFDAQGEVSAQSASAAVTTLAGNVPSGLVASYDFAEGAGATLHDASCNGNNGVITGATWSNLGMAGGALVFNGSGSWVEAPDSTSLDLTTGMTLEAWVNPASVGGDNSVIDKGLWPSFGYGLFANSSISNTPAGLAFTDSGTSSIVAFGVSGLPPNTWTHLATTYDGTTERLFVNGVQAGTAVLSGTIAWNPANPYPLRIGAAAGDAEKYFNGMIDGVRIYNRALSGQEIQSDMMLPAVNITVTPASAELSAAGTQQFSSNTVVTWSISPSVGTIDATGYYTAPSIIGVQQTVTVTATSQVNSAAQASATVTLVPSVLGSIPVPQGLTATAVSPSEIDLVWEASASAAGYVVLRNGLQIGTSLAPTYSDLGVACGGSYTYTVSAYDGLGNNSAQSASTTANGSTVSSVPGLVAYYSFNEGAGTIVHDCSGNGNDGVIDAASWSGSGKWGRGLAFNATNWVTVPDSPSLKLTTGMTLEAWVNPTYLSGALYLIGKGQPGDSDYSMDVSSAGVAGVFTLDAEETWASGGHWGGAQTVDLPMNTWTHLAVTFDGAVGNSLNIYVNGVPTLSMPAAGALRTFSNPLLIGFGSGYLAGSMDEVRIYNRALSQAEIQSDMQNAANVFVSPTVATLFPSQTQQFTAAVTKTGNVSVAWSLSPNVGSIGGSGLYTAPTVVAVPQTIIVTATSQADPSRIGTAQIILKPPVTVAVTPATSTLYASQSQPFTAISSSPGDTVTWSLSPNIGTITAYGVYTAPATVATTQTIAVTATSQADPTKSATAQISLVPAVAVSISPAASILYPSQTQQFHATVTNASNTAVAWWVSAGTIDASGLYTAPVTNAAAQTVTVMATAQADYTTTATATIALMPFESSSISVPGGLTAAAVSAAEIDLSWSASVEAGSSVAGYNVLRDGVLIGTSTTTSYSDLGLLASTTHAYMVAAYDVRGNASALSASATATTQAGIPNLAAYYNFNEGCGTIAHDLSGNGNNGVITDGTWTASGQFGGALAFNGASSWVEVPDSSVLDLTTGMTLEAWVSMASPSSQDGWVDIITKEQDQQICYGLFSTSSGDWPAGDIFVGGEQLIYGPAQVPMNTWIHLATTYDGTTQNLYVNGALVSSRPQGGVMATGPEPLHIGGDSIWGEYFTGMIDEVRIYNRALSQVEIQRDMLAGVSVAVSPATATLYASRTQQFTATVTGSGNTAVTWSIALGQDAPAGAQPGTVDASGLSMAPASPTSQYHVILTATSQAANTKSASATITLVPPVAVSISPASVALTASRTQQFTTTVINTSNRAVTWSISPTLGSVSASGLYTAPSSITTQQTVTVTATSQADTTKSASATVTLVPPIAVSISPASASLSPLGMQQFTATVVNTSNTAVTWSISPSLGSVSASGLYTAPSSITIQQTVTVTATSQADNTKKASATVSLLPPVRRFSLGHSAD